MITDILFDYHRNGVSGKGFYVCRFTNHEDGDVTPMVAVLFPTGEDRKGLPKFTWKNGCECAVFNQALLGQGEIEFGYNSFRGDHFSETLGQHIRETIAARRAGDDAQMKLTEPATRVFSWDTEREAFKQDRAARQTATTK